jgi:polysaccharide export outer membrane protein
LAHISGSDQSQALVVAAQQIVTELKTTTPVGRVVVEADPAVLESKPQLDPLMEPGDTVFVPKRPISVAVAGEVLNATSLQFEPGATPKDYIQEAGGYTQSAEPDNVFIVLPNGQAAPVKTSFWNFTPVEVPPGSTIVVPKNLAPFDLSTFLKDSTQILSQLAISGASLAVISGGSTR